MISVQNHRLPLSGNRFLVFVCMLLTLGACSSRKVLQRDEPKKEPVEKPKTPTKKEEAPEEEPAVRLPETVALLMPFQLHKVNNGVPSLQDVDRASLALDFYQGFRLALDDLSAQGAYFKLNVLDSRDNAQQVTKLAQSPEVKEAKLVVGPVFPSEINSFNNAAADSKILQISPLAASVPNLAHVERVVTTTPTLDMHAAMISEEVARNVKSGDQVFIYEVQDSDSEKYLEPIRKALSAKGIVINGVSNVDDMEQHMRVSGRNLVFCGSTNAFAISPLLAKLAELNADWGYNILLIGHPNWAKLSDLDPAYLSQLNTTITTSFYADERSADVRKFSVTYERLFGVKASEYAFKGYDTGIYFGTLLNHYPDDLTEHILDEAAHGISTGFKFRFVQGQGYINTNVQLLRFVGSEYRPLKGKL